jgi:hypothetical protein
MSRRIRVAEQHVGDSVAALAARIPGFQNRGNMFGGPRNIERTAVDEHQTTGLPVADTASKSSSCPLESFSEDREAYSALIKSISPSTIMATSLCRARDTASSMACCASCGVCAGCSFIAAVHQVEYFRTAKEYFAAEVGAVCECDAAWQNRLFLNALQNADRGTRLHHRAPHGKQVGSGRRPSGPITAIE